MAPTVAKVGRTCVPRTGEGWGALAHAWVQLPGQPWITHALDDLLQANTGAKQGNYLIGYSLSGCLIWEGLVGCLCLVILKFIFFSTGAFTGIGSGLGLGLLMRVPKL